MKTSVAWINEYLDRPASADEQAELLTRVGFPLEDREDVVMEGVHDVCQDFELSSNRGDLLSHVGLAREIASAGDRHVKLPEPKLSPSKTPASSIVSVTNREPELCPLYTARVIRGVKVAPSPRWLQNRLRARGDIPRNNIVDASNFVLFELGQPTHVFDLAKLLGPRIIIRKAKKNELFLPIGEGESEIKLTTDDLVIADDENAVAIAGVKGGAKSAVTNATTDILIETASFAVGTVRATSRRLGIISDSSYRFERGVHPGQLDAAADRLIEIILDLCGGELCEGTVSDGESIPSPRTVSMRPDRCRGVLGFKVADEQMMNAFLRLGLEPKKSNGVIECTVPIQRLDIEREEDLIEEVGRMIGHEVIPVQETIQVRVAAPTSVEAADKAVKDALVGMGYVETVTHSLIREKDAVPFLAPDLQLLKLADARPEGESVLRPSILPSLLHVYARNRDHGTPDVKLFESASTFARYANEHIERVNLALLQPIETIDDALRCMRGTIDRIVKIILRDSAQLTVHPEDRIPWFSPGAALRIDEEILGMFGVIPSSVTSLFGVDEPIAAAEIGLPQYYDRYPPESEVTALSSFPAIERDITVIIDEDVPWLDIENRVAQLNVENVEALEFVTTYRGKQIGKGRKSLTMRVRFRAKDRTLTSDEVDSQMETLHACLRDSLGAEIRQ